MDQNNTVRMWDLEAARFDEAADHGLNDPAVRAVWRDLLLEALPPAPARIADLGCGTGTLTELLADEGFAVDGIDFSPRMVQLAQQKTSGRRDITITQGDAAAPPLPPAAYEVVLCRHVLWALPDPSAALRHWLNLLRPDGRLVLIEGSWSTGAGLTAEQTVALLADVGRTAIVTALDDSTYWGRVITDERYIVMSRC